MLGLHAASLFPSRRQRTTSQQTVPHGVKYAELEVEFEVEDRCARLKIKIEFEPGRCV